jgi:hypothetical protein
MALIPADIGLRLRLDNELLPQQIAPVQEVAADLPRLQTGQVFTAQIRDVLPENTYLALVAGKTVTLSLPESVKSGDMLELVVVDQTPKTIIAQLANPTAGAALGTAAAPQTTLSQTAQMLGALLPAEGEMPAPAALNGGQPLLTQPPKSGAELAPALSKAVTESGLFYEAHQAQWVAGKLPLANLLQEPQGQQPSSQPASAPAILQASLASLLVSEGVPQVLPPLTSPIATPAQTPTPASGGAAVPTANSTTETNSLLLPRQLSTDANLAASPVLSKAIMQGILLYQTNQAQETPPPSTHGILAQAAHAADGAVAAKPEEMSSQSSLLLAASPPNMGHQADLDATRTQSATQPALTQASIPDELRPLVQQQLDAAGSQRLLWHGEVWPGQTMQWQVEWEGPGNSSAEAEEPWATTLRLITPRLGEVEASLKLGVAGVRISLSTTEAESAANLRAGAADLEQALAAAGVPLRGFSVRNDQET